MREAAPIWVLADPRAGTAAQALGVAERLGRPFRTVALEWGPLARLPLPVPSLLGLAPAARAGFRPPWPGLVLSAGRRSAPVARWLARRGARTVHLMRPGFGASGFDLLVVGQHDAPEPAPNLMTILGACHRMSPARLAAAREEWRGALGPLPGPRVALLLGGRVRAEGMAPGLAGRIAGEVVRAFPGATVMASTSRRTGAGAGAELRAALGEGPHRLFLWGDSGPNPLAGFLAWADAVVVTADSVSMLSEACATSAPVLVATEEEGRHARLVESLVAAGRVRRLADPGPLAPAVPLDESGRVAAEIARRGLVPCEGFMAPGAPPPI